MEFDLSKLPDDATIKKEDFLSFVKKIEEQHQAEVEYLQQQIQLLRNAVFGRSSEKSIAEEAHHQLPLFETADDGSDTDTVVDDQPIEIGAYKRKKRGRKPLPDHLPRVEVVHDLSDEEKVCACGHQMIRISEEKSEKLDYIPAKVQVIRHIRPKYVCKHCEGIDSNWPTVKIAPPPEQLLPKSNATAGLLAHLFISKFADALPFYRQ